MLIPQQLVDKLKLLQVAAVTGFLTSSHSGSSQSRWAITYPGHHRRLSSRPWSVQPDDPPLYCLTQHQPQGVRWQLKVGGTLVGDNNDSACRREEELLPARCKSHKFVHPSVWNVANKHLRCGGVKVLGVRAQGCLHPPPRSSPPFKGAPLKPSWYTVPLPVWELPGLRARASHESLVPLCLSWRRSASSIHRAPSIVRDPHHPSHGLLSLLLSEKRYKSICCTSARMLSSFFHNV